MVGYLAGNAFILGVVFMDMKQKTFFRKLLIFLIVVGLAYYGYNALSENARPGQQESTQKESDGQQTANMNSAPDFTVYDLQGKEVKLSDFKGKPVILNFWASWCPSCRNEMPDFDEMFDQNGAEVVFMMIDLTDGQRETEATGQEFIKEQGYKFPVYFDKNQAAAQKYKVNYIPSTFFINKNGDIIKAYEGPIGEKTLQAGIDLLKQEQP
jgi:thiol-disulfide isomerase/thioredoxin